MRDVFLLFLVVLMFTGCSRESTQVKSVSPQTALKAELAYHPESILSGYDLTLTNISETDIEIRDVFSHAGFVKVLLFDKDGKQIEALEPVAVVGALPEKVMIKSGESRKFHPHIPLRTEQIKDASRKNAASMSLEFTGPDTPKIRTNLLATKEIMSASIQKRGVNVD